MNTYKNQLWRIKVISALTFTPCKQQSNQLLAITLGNLEPPIEIGVPRVTGGFQGVPRGSRVTEGIGVPL